MPKYVIEPDIIARATRCHCSLGCLRDGQASRFCLCQLEPYAGGKLLFVTEACEEPCRYNVPFGDRAFCGCPVRRAIFEKYQA